MGFFVKTFCGQFVGVSRLFVGYVGNDNNARGHNDDDDLMCFFLFAYLVTEKVATYTFIRFMCGVCDFSGQSMWAFGAVTYLAHTHTHNHTDSNNKIHSVKSKLFGRE